MDRSLTAILPPAIAAVRAAQRNLIETSLHLTFGSAMACIGLTIPTIAIASIQEPLFLAPQPHRRAD
jgi:Ca2+:H+ antiporter